MLVGMLRGMEQLIFFMLVVCVDFFDYSLEDRLEWISFLWLFIFVITEYNYIPISYLNSIYFLISYHSIFFLILHSLSSLLFFPPAKNKKKDQTGIEPVTLGPAIPRSTTELLVLANR